MSKRILALGLDPVFADFTALPGLTPELIGSFIESQLKRVREAGYDVVSCLVDAGETAESVAAHQLSGGSFDGVLIGAGLRDTKHLLLFEKLLNLIHAKAPSAKICFNSNPADTLEAIQRWV